MGKYDLTFKSMAEVDPFALLELFGGIDVTTILKLTVVEREITIPVRVMDHSLLIETAEKVSLEHFEAQLQGGKEFFPRTLRQEVGLWLKKDLPVRVTVIWLSERHAPKEFPEWIDVDADALKIRLYIRHVKTWELEAKEILKSNRPSLWPWVGAANARKEDVLRAAERIRNEVPGIEERRRLAGELTVLTGLRYNWAEELDRRLNVIFSDEVLLESFPVQRIVAQIRASSLAEGRDVGRQEGRDEGREAGEAVEARRALRLVLRHTIPSLEASDLIDKISNVQRLEELLGMALATKDEAAVRAAIESAAS
ncbi:MAG: hypothetical protein HYZ37_01805 [Candidatus Solibacter usitatus]|nr:hypothetical protein [Candidatus Solibacter usitatus]